MKVLLALLLLISAALTAQESGRAFPPTQKRRAFVLNVLKVGPGALKPTDLYEDYINEAIYWYSQGDSEILLPLLMASVDGCTSEALGSFLGSELLRHPAQLLRRLSAFPVSIQRHAASHGVAADGSGWPHATEMKMHDLLIKMAKGPDQGIKKVAKVWLSESAKFKESQKEFE